MDLGLELLLLVRQQVDLYVRVGCATHVHGRQLCSLDDPHDELMEEDEKCHSLTNVLTEKPHPALKYHPHLFLCNDCGKKKTFIPFFFDMVAV